jgi:adenine phosphoribosyltransferase
MDLAPLIRNIPDFPKPGVQFKDITSLLQHPDAFRYIIDTWKERFDEQRIDAIVAADARGFIFGGALAYAMDVKFVPTRKVGKLPGDTITQDFQLEYGEATMELHRDALEPGDRCLLLDDLLATGGTMEAMVKLVQMLQAKVVEILFVVELPPLKGRERLQGYPVSSLVEFMVE